MNRSFDLQADVRHTDLSSANRDRLKLRIQGPWGEPRWNAGGEIQLPEATGLNTALRLDAQWRTPWLQDQQPSVAVDRLRLSAPGLRFGLAGTIGSRLDLRSTELQICLLYTSPSPRDGLLSRMPSSA